MRNIPIPVDATKLQFTCVKAPRPRLLNQETGQIKTDKNGHTVYEVVLSAEDDFGRIELVKIGTSEESLISAGQQVTPVGMVGYVWEMSGRWGISYRAASIVPAQGSALA
jgi:DNA/RNA endonuclease YhcR with UshA esterase domain